MIRTACYWTFLLLPLLAFALPGFQSTLEEDALVIVSAVYLMLRAANPLRRKFSEWLESSLSTLFFIVLYGVGWMGLWRGYGDIAGLSILFYPICLMAAVWIERNDAVQNHALYSAWIVITWLLILSYCFSDLTITNYISSIVALSVIGLSIAISMQKHWLRCQINMNSIFLSFAFAAICLGSSNYQLWRTWYNAGEASRAWAPHQYVEENAIRSAKQAPYTAYWQYHQLIDLLDEKGSLPKRYRWDRKFHAQMQKQIVRKLDLKLAELFLHDSRMNDSIRGSFISQMTGNDFYQRYINQSPNREEIQRLFIDAEYNDLTNSFYLLDRWGGVHQWRNEEIELAWKPDQSFEDPIDLEIQNNMFYVLRSDRTIVTSKDVPWVQGELSPFLFGGDVVDFELFEEMEGALLVSSKGEIASYGQTPAEFPSWGELYFQEDVVVDLEIDLDERGYYLLDCYGAVHGNHADGQSKLAYRSPPIAEGLVPYWAGQRMAIDLEIDAQGRGMNIYNKTGELFTIAKAPYRETYRPAPELEERGVSLIRGATNALYSLESNGRIIKMPADVN